MEEIPVVILEFAQFEEIPCGCKGKSSQIIQMQMEDSFFIVALLYFVLLDETVYNWP